VDRAATIPVARNRVIHPSNSWDNKFVMRLHNSILTVTVAASFIVSVRAFAGDKPGNIAPTDASASVPPTQYRSAFSGYQSQQELALRPWRDVNDEMGRLGGHVGHLKDSAPSDSASPSGSGVPMDRDKPDKN
jgi:hypothetical protein